jgi:TPR repeat protein
VPGVPKDLVAAVKLLTKASDMGHDPASYVLGNLLLKGGDGLAKNETGAVKRYAQNRALSAENKAGARELCMQRSIEPIKLQPTAYTSHRGPWTVTSRSCILTYTQNPNLETLPTTAIWRVTAINL